MSASLLIERGYVGRVRTIHTQCATPHTFADINSYERRKSFCEDCFMRRALVLTLLIALSGCSTSSNQGSTPNGVTQEVAPHSGQSASQRNAYVISADSISLSAMGPVTGTKRIVALANGSAEILYALGAGKWLVGRDIASSFAQDKSVPIVTSAHSISAEKVLAQKPDLVITDSRSGPLEALKQIKSAGVVIKSVPDAWTLSDMAIKIRAVGQVAGLQARADQLIAEQESQLQKLPQTSGPRVAFLYLRGTASVYLLGGKGSGADALLQSIGATDVGAEANLRAFTPLTSEALVKANPNVILVMTKGLDSVGGIEGLIKLPGVAQTDAGKHQRVIAVDDSLLLSFGPRTPGLLVQLARAITSEMAK